MTVFNTFVPKINASKERRGPTILQYFQRLRRISKFSKRSPVAVACGQFCFPQRPCRGYSEAYFRRLRALGILTSQAHSIAVSRKDFDTNSFCLATNLEKHDQVASTGLNTQGVDIRISGSQLSDGQNEADSSIDRVYFHTHQQIFVELRAGSVTLLT